MVWGNPPSQIVQINDLTNYLTTTNAASTYQTQSGLKGAVELEEFGLLQILHDNTSIASHQIKLHNGRLIVTAQGGGTSNILMYTNEYTSPPVIAIASTVYVPGVSLLQFQLFSFEKRKGASAGGGSFEIQCIPI